MTYDILPRLIGFIGIFALYSAGADATDQMTAYQHAVEQERAYSWQADHASGHVSINHILLRESGISVVGKSQRGSEGHYLQFDVRPAAGDALSFSAPFGNFEKLTGGSAGISLSLAFEGPGGRLDLTQLYLRPNPDKRVTFNIDHANLGTLFAAEMAHAQLFAEQGRAEFRYMDLRATHAFADQLGLPGLAGLVVGNATLRVNITAPQQAALGLPKGAAGGACDDRPLWSEDGLDTDVELTGIPNVQRLRNEGDYAVVAPSAELKNSGVAFADVPWWSKFSGTNPPYNTDQHPFLVWSMYREHEGRFAQLGNSGIKHAFFTINGNCDLNCDNANGGAYFGQVLWPGCEDLYSLFTNDSNNNLGPREEVNPRTGVWDNCGSFFDPACTGTQTQASSQDENRLLVPLAAFEAVDEGARFWLDSWYVIRDDVNIFNSMGYRELSPTLSPTGWNVGNNIGPFSQGSPVDVWVPAGTAQPRLASQMIETRTGHYQLAVKVTLNQGRWRYAYALMNFDSDIGLDEFSMPVDSSLTPSNLYFNDGDQDTENSWSFSHDQGVASWTAPAGTALQWGRLYTFSFDIDGGPVSQTIEVSSAIEGTATSVSLAPDFDLLFIDGVEPQ